MGPPSPALPNLSDKLSMPSCQHCARKRLSFQFEFERRASLYQLANTVLANTLLLLPQVPFDPPSLILPTSKPCLVWQVWPMTASVNFLLHAPGLDQWRPAPCERRKCGPLMRGGGCYLTSNETPPGRTALLRRLLRFFSFLCFRSPTLPSSSPPGPCAYRGSRRGASRRLHPKIGDQTNTATYM